MIIAYTIERFKLGDKEFIIKYNSGHYTIENGNPVNSRQMDLEPEFFISDALSFQKARSYRFTRKQSSDESVEFLVTQYEIDNRAKSKNDWSDNDINIERVLKVSLDDVGKLVLSLERLVE
jgi:hypothetical protein